MLVFLLCFAFQDPKFLQFKETRIDLGTIPIDRKAEGAFFYESLSDLPLDVYFMLSTCQCSLLESGQLYAERGGMTTLPPKDKGYMAFEMEPPPPGPFEHYLEIFIKSQGWEQKVRLNIVGTVISPIHIEPTRLHIDLAQEPLQLPQIKIYPEAGTPLQEVSVEMDPQWLTFDAAALGSYQVALNEAIYTNGGETLKGDIHVKYRLKGKMIEVPLPYEIAVPNPCPVNPPSALFGRVSQPIERIQKVELETGSLTVTGVAWAPEYLQVKFGKIDETRTVVYLHLKQKPPSVLAMGQGFNGNILLETNQPQRPIRIPFAGKIVAWDE